MAKSKRKSLERVCSGDCELSDCSHCSVLASIRTTGYFSYLSALSTWHKEHPASPFRGVLNFPSYCAASKSDDNLRSSPCTKKRRVKKK